MSDIATRALAAHEAETEARKLEGEAKAVRDLAEATEKILAKAAQLSIADVDPSQIRVEGSLAKTYSLKIPLNADATLLIEVNPHLTAGKTRARVMPCDQLYWGLPPGEETKGRGAGTYGQFNLSGIKEREVESLVDIGGALRLIADARTAWHRKHGPTR